MLLWFGILRGMAIMFEKRERGRNRYTWMFGLENESSSRLLSASTSKSHFKAITQTQRKHSCLELVNVARR